MELLSLINQNPWWKDPTQIDQDKKIFEVDHSKNKWVPRIITYFDLQHDHVYTLRGPRQVGKTTLLKIMIRDLLQKSVTPRAVFYFTCDMITGHQELVDTIEKYFDFNEHLTTSERRFIFIDEITSVKSWEKAIKYLVDANKLKNTTVILTGSHSMDIKYSTERLPGRRGETDIRTGDTLNKILVPMKFSEYVETVAPELKHELSNFFNLKKDRRYDIIFNLFSGKVDTVLLDELRLYEKEIKTLMDNYLVTGGIIRAIEGFHNKENIDNALYEIYIRSLIGDLARWGYQENIAKQIIRSALNKMTTRVSLNSIAKENEIGSHNTVSSYLKSLEDSYVLNTFYQFDLNHRTARYKKERKLYFVDPFIYHAFRGWSRGEANYFESSRDVLIDNVKKGKILEMVLAGHLIRLVYNLHPSDVFSHHEQVFYWKKKGSEREVDFIFKVREEYFPVELKYQNTISRRDMTNLFSLRKGIIVSKNKFDTFNQYSTIPIEIFLMLI